MTGLDTEPPCHSAPDSCDKISGCRLLGLYDFMCLRFTKSEHKEIQDALKEALEMGIAPAYGTQSFGETCMSGSASPDVDPTVLTQAGQMLRNDREASLLRLPKSIGVVGIQYHISAPTSR